MVTISHDPKKFRLKVEIDFPDPSVIYTVIVRVKNLFDLDSDPVLVANSLERDPKIKKLLKAYPGIRLPSGWDKFEIAIATILGQLVSLERGRRLVHDLIEIAGIDSDLKVDGRTIKLFPTPQRILEADLSPLKTTRVRKDALKEFSRALIDGRLSLESAQNVEEFTEKVLAIKGIGPWTAQYMALKVLRSTDSFPACDLILARALKGHSATRIESMRPWRGYVAALLWRSSSSKPSVQQKRI